MNDEALDILIVGAGLSGIDAAIRIAERCPTRRVTIFEARERMGGTWDLFRYPGIRSDSDMFTLSYPFQPWTGRDAIADGPEILAYLQQTAERHRLEPRFGHRVVRVAWSTAQAQWTVEVVVDGSRRQFTCRFLYLCTGYYDYEQAHDPQIPGSFGGRVVHPQWWPSDLDLTGRQVLVIGSGATAINLLPALARQAAHVTMVQRSPTWVAVRPRIGRAVSWFRAVAPAAIAHPALRARNAVAAVFWYQLCRRLPRVAERALLRTARRALPPGYPVDTHFHPRYPPWDQRLCLAADGDLFAAIRSGRASVVTGTIARYTAGGLQMADGQELSADVIVTATGLRLLPFGGMTVEVDGVPVEPSKIVVYQGVLLGGVPNAAWAMGYTNASWTLRADLTSRFVCRLLRYMDRRGFRSVVPRAPPDRPRRPVMNLNAGYLLRARDRMPVHADQAPWIVRQNFLLDAPLLWLARVDGPDLQFT